MTNSELDNIRAELDSMGTTVCGYQAAVAEMHSILSGKREKLLKTRIMPAWRWGAIFHQLDELFADFDVLQDAIDDALANLPVDDDDAAAAE